MYGRVFFVQFFFCIHFKSIFSFSHMFAYALALPGFVAFECFLQSFCGPFLSLSSSLWLAHPQQSKHIRLVNIYFVSLDTRQVSHRCYLSTLDHILILNSIRNEIKPGNEMKNECSMKEYDFDGIGVGDERCASGKTFLNKKKKKKPKTRNNEWNEEEICSCKPFLR